MVTSKTSSLLTCIINKIVYFILTKSQLYTISANGRLNIWECDTDLDGLKPYVAPEGNLPKIEVSSDEEDDEDESKNKGE